MGTVFCAEDTATGEEVALKQVGGRNKTRGDKRSELCFRREYHSLARLSHPRIVQVFDYGVDPEGAFYTMELLGGQDLKAAGQLAWTTGCRILRDVAAALAFLHSRRLIHRDLAPGNIRVGDDGRARLFDFGLLATVGLAGEVAGSPSCIAPESLRGLPLDGRTDLYALGCVAFRMFTGKYPYPARTLNDLERLWRTPAPTVRSLVPDVPQALDALVTSLICLDPLGRPSSAAEVIDRLQAIANLEPDPELQQPEGYLASASMVGRRREVALLKECIVESVGGHGRAMFVEATSGTGKSRLLREVALEAQLSGAKPLIASSEAATFARYGVLRTLVADAIHEAPKAVVELDRAHASIVARVFPDLADKLGPVERIEVVAEPAEERLRIQTALSGWFLDLASRVPLAILVDDLQRCDEASAAVLAGLARQASEHALTICVALREEEPIRAPVAVAALREVDLRLGLRGLTEEEVLELVESLFGKVRHAGRLAAWMHGVSQGSPLHCTELARTLVDSRAARFIDGIWILPSDVTAHDVPIELGHAMDARIAQLSDSARGLAEVLASYAGQFDLSIVRDLAAAIGEEAWFGALDELVHHSLLTGDGDRFRFRHDGLREAVLRGLGDTQVRETHLLIGRMLQAHGEDEAREAEIGWHLFEGGEALEGARYLERVGRRLFEVQALSDSVRPLEAALVTLEEHGVVGPRLLEIRFMLVAAGWISDRQTGLRHMYGAVEAYRDYAGLRTAAWLGPKLGRHLALVFGVLWASVRWVFSRSSNRGPSPLKATSAFAVTAGYAAGLEYANHSLEGLNRLVALAKPMDAFRGSMVHAAYEGMSAFPDLLLGRLGVAKRKLEAVLHTVVTDRFAPFTDFERRFAAAGIRSLLGQIQVTNLDPELPANLKAMRELGVKYYQLVADTMEATSLRFQGDERQARAIEAGLEPMTLQLGSWSTDIQSVLFSHPGYALCGDIMGLKRMADALARLCDDGFDYRARLRMTRGDYHRARGEYEQAAECLGQAFEFLHDDECLTRVWVLTSLAEVHLAQGEYASAARSARDAVDRLSDPDNVQVSIQIRASRALALAEAGMGEVDDAERRLDAAIEQARALGAAASTGLCHEARARVALGREDFEAYSLHCAEAQRWLRPTANPALIGVAERLVEAGPSEVGEAAPIDLEASDAVTTIEPLPDSIGTQSHHLAQASPDTVH